MQVKMKIALVAGVPLLCGGLLSPSPASAEGPSPRGPVGGCGAGFELATIEQLTALNPRAGAFALEVDVNQDEQVCSKLLVRRPAGGGVIVDNVAVGRG